jgi:hypothetical protein
MLLAVSCSNGAKQKTSLQPAPSTSKESTASSSTSTSSSTTTTPAPATTAPLTGLPQADPAKLGRPALVVKIDNLDPDARPQTGVTTADICFEEQVEGGITRFACIWQSRDTGAVGPVRSTRTTDIAIVSELNHPLYAFSGGNANFLAAIRAAPIVDVGADTKPNAYYRSGPKQPPHNLFSNVTTLYGFAPPGAGPPPALWPFRAAGAPSSAAGAVPASDVDMKFPDAGGPLIAWDWDPASQTWLRSQNGTPDVTTDHARIAAANVVFQFVSYPIVGYQRVGNVSGPIPMAQLIGQGDAIVFTGGAMVQAHWSKPSAGAVTQYTDAAGTPIEMAPGQTWIELAPLGTPANSR